MDNILFTYPNCLKCESLKKSLEQKGIAYSEYSLVQPKGKAKIREFIQYVRRDERGAIILPTLVVSDQVNATTVITSTEELDQWLKSKA